MQTGKLPNLYEANPQIVSIASLCNSDDLKFFIPSYQRGYRWGEAEIHYLLRDIANYDPERDGKFYCLQPIVVHLDEKNRWRLVDGQQRLTTLYLIIKTLWRESKVYDIEFERGSKFPGFENENLSINDSTPENYYLTQAYHIIKKWVLDHPLKYKALRKNLIETGDVRVIWYPIDKGFSINHEFDFFMHLNSGKIQLTDSELVKALLLHDIHRGENIEKTLVQTSMAEEWNSMEKKLREPSFWHFIAGRKPIPECAMDYLLEAHYKSLILEEDKYSKYPYPVFAWTEDQLNFQNKDKELASNKMVWNDIRRTFSIIEGWYNDFQTYNLIGHMTTVTLNKNPIICLLRRMRENKLTKQSFISSLWKDIVEDSNLIPPEDKVALLEGKYDNLKIYNYHYQKNYFKVFELLTFVNIAQYTIGGMKRRFEFDRYNDPTTPWNIEHISPQNPKNNDALLTFIESAKQESNDLPEEIEELYQQLRKLQFLQTQNRYNEEIPIIENKVDNIRAKVLPFSDEEIMTLGNLTLLTEHNNKSIGNKFFFIKKKVLRQKQSEGHYIPQVTQDVFTKWYSKKPKSPLLWENSDRNDYLRAIAEILNKTYKYINKYYPTE